MLLALLGAMSSARVASAADECVDSHGKAQELREAGKLRAARDALTQCAKKECPELIVEDCSRWLEEVSRAMPSIVIRGTQNGQDVDDVAVFVDDERVASALDGKPIELDPGRHRLRLTTHDDRNVEREIVVKQGVTNQVIELALPATVASTTEHEKPGTPTAGPSPFTWVAAGVGVLGVAGFTYFALHGKNRYDDLDDVCSPNCKQSDSDDVKRDFLFADISLAIGVLGLGTATYLYLSGSASPRPAASGVVLSGGALRRGGFLGVSGRY